MDVNKFKTKSYCTCIGGEKNYTKFYEVDADSHGLCRKCGYYAVYQIDVPNMQGNINYISKDIILHYLKTRNNNFSLVGNILDINVQQVKKVLGKRLTRELANVTMI